MIASYSGSIWYWLNWAIVIALYFAVGSFLVKLLGHKFQIPSIVFVIYIGVGVLVAVLLMPGSLYFYYHPCLPAGVELTDVASAEVSGSGDALVIGGIWSWSSLQQKLIELGAYCANGVLAEPDGKQIRIYQLTGCWGNPPRDYEDILREQSREIAKLNEQYTVIGISCNPTGRMLE